MTGAARDHALPIDLDRPEELVELLHSEGAIPAGLAAPLAQIARSLAALFHHDFLAVKQRLRRAWSALEAADGRADPPQRRELAKDLVHTLRRLLRRANFVAVPVLELHEALRREGAFGLAVDLDLADFEELEVWRRRIVRGRRPVPALFGLKRREQEVELFDRFCIYARFKAESRLPPERVRRRKLGFVPGSTTLRLFRDVPRHDVEALLPGVRVRMRMFDRALIGVPAAAGVFHFLVFKIGTSIGAIGLALLVFLGLRKREPELEAKALGACASLAVLLAFLFRQWMRFLGRKNLLHRQLAEQLQTCTLDAGVGVLLHLLDEAEEEEMAEALLAYAFLARAGRPLPAGELDREVETWLARRFGIEVDFEEEDALGKLARLGLVTRGADGMLAAVEPERALALLESTWRERLRPR